jgi:putative spermidine/putrescine transport system ATP-binding protein
VLRPATYPEERGPAVTETVQGSEALPIAIRRVTKTYGKVFALDHVDLDVKSGEFLTLLGPSGSGKTTLLMVLAGFTRPDHGSVKFGDTEMIRTPPHKRDVGMVFQNYALFPHMTVLANVAFPLKLRKVPKADAAARAERALETVQLGGYGERRVDQLSGGQKQRVALARAIVFEPRILLMDEPLSALDKKLREHMQIELRHLHDKLGMTTVYVTHDQREALTMSDRIAVINHGRLMQLDAPRRLYDHPANRFVADFIGESTFLPVDVADGTASYAGIQLKLPESVNGGGNRDLLLRPERLSVLTDDPDPDMNVFTGTVQDLVFQGESFLMYAVLADGSEVAVRGGTKRDLMESIPPVGSPVSLGLHRDDTIVVAGGED